MKNGKEFKNEIAKNVTIFHIKQQRVKKKERFSSIQSTKYSEYVNRVFMF